MKSTEIRQVNEKNILRILHTKGVVTQVQIAVETGLQASTVFRIFRALEERNVVRPAEGAFPKTAGPPKQGRRPGYYELNPDGAYSLGVDFAHRGAAVLLVDFQGKPVREHEIQFSATASAGDTVDQILVAIRTVLRAENVSTDQLLGVGMGAPGVVDIAAGRVVKYSRFPGMEQLPIGRTISDDLGIPVYMHNNASVIALAENRYGRAAGLESVVAVLIRSGVGGAFVQNGQLYTSQGMSAFEIGHMALDVMTAESPSESLTLENILSEEALVERVQRCDSTISDWEKLVAALESEQPIACEALDEAAHAFFVKARNIALMLNPEAFLIIARHKSVANYFARRLGEALSSSEWSGRFSVSSVVPLEYDPILACRGAADLVFDHFFTTTAVQ